MYSSFSLIPLVIKKYIYLSLFYLILYVTVNNFQLTEMGLPVFIRTKQGLMCLAQGTR